MKKLLSIAFLLIVPLFIVKAEETKSTMDLLTGQTWKLYNSYSRYNVYQLFTRDKVIDITVTDNRNIKKEYWYYLSDTDEGPFDNSKMGKSVNGKHIYLYDPEDGWSTTMEIIELSEEKFVYLNIINVREGVTPRPDIDYTIYYSTDDKID
ncbi:MAG: hypothetical protein LUF90_10240 [Rikenellaceae bacterium]|nr:hypothetical protein [Rikenellaceae bacterium]